MNQTIHQSTRQPYLSAFVRYVVMNVLSMIGMSIYILADTYFISKGLGANGLAALNLALPAYNIVNGCALMLGVGGAACFIAHKTANDKKASDRVFSTVLCFGMVLGLIFSLCGVLFSGKIARLLGADHATFANTNIYLRMIWLFAPMFIVNQILSAFVKNDGNPRLAMIGMLAGSLFNIIFDYIFIFPCHLGMFGAVLATVFSPVVGILILSTHFRHAHGFDFVKQGFNLSDLVSAISAGVPSLVMEMASGLVMLVFNMLILRLAGNNGVAAYGVMANILFVIIAIDNGIAQGVQPLFGSTFASGDKAGLKQVWHYAVITILIAAGIFYVLTFGFAAPLTRIFNSENNAILQKIAVAGFPLYFSQCAFLGMNTIFIMYFVSTGRNRLAQTMSLLKGFIIVMPLAVVLSYTIGLAGIWMAMGITEAVVCVIGCIAFKKPLRS